jgi:hypothetical protein
MGAVELMPAEFPGQVQRFTHNWWIMAMLFDPVLSYREGDVRAGPRGMICWCEVQYWTDKFNSVNFPQKQVHQPFLFTVNFAKRVALLDQNRRAGDRPAILDPQMFPGGSDQFIQLGFNFTRLPENNRILLNLMGTVLYQMRAAGGTPPSTGSGGAAQWKGKLERFAASTTAAAEDKAQASALLKLY